MIALAGADGVGRNRHAFDHAVRIAFQDAAIHERAGVAFVAVADDVLHVAGGLGHRAPLQSGRITAAAAPAQAALGDLLDHVLWASFRSARSAAPCSRRAQCSRRSFPDRCGRSSPARRAPADRSARAGCIADSATGSPPRLAAMLLRVLGVHVLVEYLFGIHQHQRAGGAQAHAAGAAHQILFLRLPYGRGQAPPSACQSAGSGNQSPCRR